MTWTAWSWPRLMFPVAAGLNSMNSPYANFKLSGKLTTANPRIQEHTNKNNVSLIKQCSSVFRPFVCPMNYAVQNIFVRSAITKIARRIIISVPIYVTNDRTVWSLARKRFRYYGMDCFRRLRLILRSFFERNRKIWCARIKFFDKPFTVFDNRHTSKVAYYISIMSYYRNPIFKGISHG